MEQKSHGGRWKKLDIPNLPHLQEAASAVIGTKIYIFGGETRVAGSGSECNTLWCFDAEAYDVCF